MTIGAMRFNFSIPSFRKNTMIKITNEFLAALISACIGLVGWVLLTVNEHSMVLAVNEVQMESVAKQVNHVDEGEKTLRDELKSGLESVNKRLRQIELDVESLKK